jgi:hypothetical protein
MAPVAIIILIIFLAGLLGGITNYLLLCNADSTSTGNRILFLKSVFMGICASIAVPLFLQVLPNNLLDMLNTKNNINNNINNDNNNNNINNANNINDKNYFILAGLCVLASFYSKRFLEDLYDRVTKAEKKADEATKAVATAELQNQEIDNINDIVGDIIKKYKPPYSDDEIKDVADAVLNTTYSYRTIHGISEDTFNDDEKVTKILELLKEAGYIESKKNSDGNDIWKSIYHQ